MWYLQSCVIQTSRESYPQPLETHYCLSHVYLTQPWSTARDDQKSSDLHGPRFTDLHPLCLVVSTIRRHQHSWATASPCPQAALWYIIFSGSCVGDLREMHACQVPRDQRALAVGCVLVDTHVWQTASQWLRHGLGLQNQWRMFSLRLLVLLCEGQGAECNHVQSIHSRKAYTIIFMHCRIFFALHLFRSTIPDRKTY